MRSFSNFEIIKKLGKKSKKMVPFTNLVMHFIFPQWAMHKMYLHPLFSGSASEPRPLPSEIHPLAHASCLSPVKQKKSSIKSLWAVKSSKQVYLETGFTGMQQDWLKDTGVLIRERSLLQGCPLILYVMASHAVQQFTMKFSVSFVPKRAMFFLFFTGILQNTNNTFCYTSTIPAITHQQYLLL